MKKFLAIVLALAMVLAFAACGTAQEEKGSYPTPVTTEATKLQEISVCLGGEPDTIDPALNSAAYTATITLHLFSGLTKWVQDENGNLAIMADAAVSLPEPTENVDGTVTYVYTIGNSFWSDGRPVTAQDFVFAWNRAASPELAGNYHYMFDVVKGYAEMWETDEEGNFLNKDAKLAVKAIDDKTLEITLISDVPYWKELLAFPVFFPTREDVVSDESWATEPETYICNGPYIIEAWSHDSVITLGRNPHYANPEAVSMDQINFYLSSDANNMLLNFKNGDWQMIEEVPTNEIANMKVNYEDEFKIVGQIGTYFAFWNVNYEILPVSSDLTGVEAEKARAEIRSALSLLLDRNYVVEQITQSGQVPASSFVAMGLLNNDGSEFYKTAGNYETNGYFGYFDTSEEAMSANIEKAIQTLKKYYTYDEAMGKFTDFPIISYTFNMGDSHQAIAEYMKAVFENVGIDLELRSMEWGSFVTARQSGDYILGRNGLRADYNDPICFLDLWATNTSNNDIQFGRDGHKDLAMYSMDLRPHGYDIFVENGTWAETYDVLIATIKSCKDVATRTALMHVAEDLLMSTGCVMPIYFYTDIYMLSKNVTGCFSNPFGHKYFMYGTIQ